ncbi:MAG: PDZ domain-containing protein [Gemmatimonadota bacterium]
MARKTAGAGALGFVLAGMAGAVTTPGAAQQAPPPPDRECACEDGPRWEGPGVRVLSLGAPRARMGVGLRADADGRGAEITTVAEGSPAEEAGLREGDVILSINGSPLDEPREGRRGWRVRGEGSVPVQRLMELARDWDPGDRVEVGFLRDGDERSATVVVEENDDALISQRMLPLMDRARDLGQGLRSFSFEDEPRMRVFGGGPGAFWFGGAAGLELHALTPELGRYFGTEEGVLVLDVEDDSSLGLRAGDVILAIGARAVDEPRDVLRVLGSYEDDEPVELEIVRDGERTTVEGRTGR